MNEVIVTELSQKLTSYQKGKVLSLLRYLSDCLHLEIEKDLGAENNKKRILHFKGKKLTKIISVAGDRVFLEKLIGLLEEESVLADKGRFSIESNEADEEHYGYPISIAFPADFEERRRVYEQSLERLYQEKVRASIPSTHAYKAPAWWVRVLSFIGKGLAMLLFIPLYLLWSGGKKMAGDVGGYVYKSLVVVVGAFLLYEIFQWVAPILKIGQ